MKNDAPIAVFDSGLGGISVLKELICLMPSENYLYFGDSKNAPYGPRSAQEVCDLAAVCARKLFEMGCKAMVVACNTATSVAIGVLRATYPEIPIVGIEPAVKPAVLAFEHPRVLVMATERTLKQERFLTQMQTYADRAEILRLPAPGIVECVERGDIDGPELRAYLSSLLAPYRNARVDAIVLGCTHFPLVRRCIEQAIGYPVAIFDGAPGTARETKRRLRDAGLLSACEGEGSVRIINSMQSAQQLAAAWKLFCAS